jgi:CheY-like chemotaxis protein
VLSLNRARARLGLGRADGASENIEADGTMNMGTAAETEISFERKKNRKKSRPHSDGGKQKDPDRVRLCGLSYLVVDDSRFDRATVKDALHGIGIRNIVEMESAGEALHYVYHHPVDAIVADFDIPGMNGAEFVWQLRRSRDERVRRIPVIMVSDHADEGPIRAAIKAGVNDYIPKPFSQSELYARLRRSIVSPRRFLVTPGYVGPDRRLSEERARQGIERRCGLSPSDLLDEPAAETTRTEAAPPAAAPANPTAKPEPSFSVLSETAVPRKTGDDGPAAQPHRKL